MTKGTRLAPWLLVVPGALWVAVRLVGFEWGPLVQLLAFTPYVAAWSVLPAVLALALRRWQAAVVAGLVVAAFAACVLPRAFADGGAAAGGPALRVLTANLRVGSADAAALVDLVRAERVDVLVVQELTPEAQAALDAHGLATLLPERRTTAEPGATGSGLYARFPLRDTGSRRNEGGFTQSYGTLAVPGAAPVLVESVHPMSPYALSVLGLWRADLAAEPAATPDGAVRVLAGDFNATLDHAALRRLLDTGYRDAAAVAGAGLVGTWGPYDGDPIPPVTLDHVLADRRVGVRAVAVHGVPDTDHRALLAELALP